MADFLAEKRQEIANRLKELAPLVEEAAQLQAALDALDAAAGRPAARKPSAPRKPRAAKKGTGARGRPKGSGKRQAEALKLVKKQPGITIAEIAAAMGIQQDYLYRVLPGLQAEGKVRKEGRGWYPAGS